MKQFKRVLITGTTSGLGKALLEKYYPITDEVICINRSSNPLLEAQYPKCQFEIFDITDYQKVHGFLSGLMLEGGTPDLFILNAGINQPDNYDGLDFEAFNQVMQINLNGVLSFVGAIHKLAIMDAHIACVSSTSNIVPNPAHIGYYLSKLSLYKAFKLLALRDRENHYQSVVLGPVHTEIMAGYPGPTGLTKWIFDSLAVTPKDAAKKLYEFFGTQKERLLFPLSAVIFYYLVDLLLLFFPNLYQGTKKPTLMSSALEKSHYTSHPIFYTESTTEE